MSEVRIIKLFKRKAATVFIKDGYVKLMLPSGEVLDMVTETKVTQSVDGMNRLDLSCFVNVCATEEEAKALYGPPLNVSSKFNGNDILDMVNKPYDKNSGR